MKIYKPLLPLAAAAVIGGGAGAVATNAVNGDSATTVRTITNTRTVASTTGSTVESPHDVYQNAKDSVAYITTQVGTGSGFVASDAGYIAPTPHVAEGASAQTKAKWGDAKT